MGIEEIKYVLLADLGRHRNLLGIQIGESGANPFGTRDHSAYAGGDVVGALIADHLQGHAWSNLAFKRRVGGIIVPRLRESGEKAPDCWTKSRASDVHLDRLPFHLDLFHFIDAHTW